MKVFIGILSMGDVHGKLALAIAKMINHPDYTVELAFVGAKRVEASRNIIAKKFLESDCDYLLMIDEDNPPVRNPLELLKELKDVLIFPTPIFYDKKVVWNIERGGRPDKPMDGLEKIKTGGTGCILIKRKVLKGMDVPFQTEVDNYGVTILGQDIRFCQEVTKLGYSIWTHWAYPCEHYKTINLLELMYEKT